MNASANNVSRLMISANNPVDRIGIIKANIAALEDEAAPIIAELKASGPGNYSGEMYDANVAEVSAVESFDPKAMEAKLRELGVDGRWFAKNTKVRAASLRLTVKARK